MSKKGITPIIAIVLLLMMTVAAAGMAYLFMQGLMTTGTSQINQDWTSRLGSMQTRLSIESIAKTGTVMTIYLRNTGSTTIDTTTLSLYVDGTLKTTGITYVPASVPAGALTTITTDIVFPAVNTAKTIKITSSAGASSEYICSVSSATALNC